MKTFLFGYIILYAVALGAQVVPGATLFAGTDPAFAKTPPTADVSESPVVATGGTVADTLDGRSRRRAFRAETAVYAMRPYIEVATGLSDWGRDSPCGCRSFSARLGSGAYLTRTLRLGGHAALQNLVFLLGVDAGVAVLPLRRLEVFGAYALRPAKTRRDELPESRAFGASAVLGLVYRPWAARPLARAWQLYAGYVRLDERFSAMLPDGRSGSRTFLTHVGYEVRIGYSL